ncbi:hypothetical protein MHZ92_10815 [Sporosarcina sp. ACRSL]|uniref:hypothetical protein n=1 Tax=Sporosarcina sp. ACRSL TaxID=2918215 RepID=UPI001EF6E04F|nr:hypothetical protein [Sporosarcina sp. ACRSL]MCG7344630.1 hypothetical protein [Sporosarcina sp. ACRSL]
MKVVTFEEESTSVFVPKEELVREKIDVTPSVQAVSHVVNPAILEKISYLSAPFQKQVYKPLQFVIEGESVKGTIQKVENDIVWIEAGDLITEVEISKIEDVLWRGQPFDTKS